MIAILFALLGAAVEPQAAVVTEHVQATLLSEQVTVAPGDTLTVALRQQIISEWHTYWENPGDSGEPVRLDWDLPDGLRAGPIQWPAPERLPVGPLVNYGFSGTPVFLSDIEVPSDWPAGQAIALRVDASWLVCKEECVPEYGTLALKVPTAATTRVATDRRELFTSARRAQPVPVEWPARYAATIDSLALAIDVVDAGSLTDAYFFPAAWGVIDHAATQRLDVGDDNVQLQVARGDGSVPDTLRGVLRLTGANGTRNYILSAEPGVVAATTGDGTDTALWVLLAGALLGGLILNLMPCVFPVLAIKGLALASHSRAPAAERFAGGIAYTIGIVLSFLLLAAVVLALKAGGEVVGWGFQLQNPAIVSVLAFVLFAVGLNLSGVFSMGNWLSTLDHSASRKSGLVGSFATGCLAAVVAAPCTAPFMATAVGVALVQSAAVTVVVFATLGLGLALPYLLLSAAPRVARMLPEPGAWMERLRQLLAFPMYLSTAWLLWVLAQQVDPNELLLALVGLIAIAFAAWALQQGSGWLSRGSATASIALALYLAVFPIGADRQAAPEIAAEAFSSEKLAELRAEGKSVFVNMTAAWCITCKVNERVALSSEAFAEALAGGNIAYLQGDWTNRSEEIRKYLQRFDRAGVPLYVFYPADGEPIVLPQILTESIVIDALRSNPNQRRT